MGVAVPNRATTPVPRRWSGSHSIVLSDLYETGNRVSQEVLARITALRDAVHDEICWEAGTKVWVHSTQHYGGQELSWLVCCSFH